MWDCESGQTGNARRMEAGKSDTNVDLNDGLVALQWKDKRLVTMVSTIHDDEMIRKQRRTRRADDGTEEILKPMSTTHTWEGVYKSVVLWIQS